MAIVDTPKGGRRNELCPFVPTSAHAPTSDKPDRIEQPNG